MDFQDENGYDNCQTSIEPAATFAISVLLIGPWSESDKASEVRSVAKSHSKLVLVTQSAFDTLIDDLEHIKGDGVMAVRDHEVVIQFTGQVSESVVQKCDMFVEVAESISARKALQT